MKTQYNKSILQYNTFNVDVIARYFTEVTTIDELTSFLGGFDQNEPLLIMGGGSNILFVGDYEGTILKMGINGIEKIGEDESSIFVRAFAGEDWDTLVEYCVKNGYGGIENLSHIPGSVGAAPIQNIGAYDVELKDVFVELEAIEIKTGKKRIFSKEDCAFGYRNSVFKNELKGQYIILSITLRLNKRHAFKLTYGELAKRFNNKLIIGLKEIRDTIIEIRNIKLPGSDEYGCAGSFFKNPEVTREKATELEDKYEDLEAFQTEDGKMKIPAGWLIEQCGLQGIREGDAGVYEKHALILVNHGNATGEEIFNLAKKIRGQVEMKFGIQLEFEVNVIGN